MSVIGEMVHYKVLVDDIIKAVGEDAIAIINLLEHGHTKRSIAKVLKRPYPEVKDVVVKIKKYLEKVGEGPIINKRHKKEGDYEKK